MYICTTAGKLTNGKNKQLRDVKARPKSGRSSLSTPALISLPLLHCLCFSPLQSFIKLDPPLKLPDRIPEALPVSTSIGFFPR
jgi:hypothetical protein